MLTILAVALLSYLVGSFPASIVASKLFRGIDIRQYGSGNAGGTNAFRVLGWKIGLGVALVDIGKGMLATLFISQWQWPGHPSPLSPIQMQILAGSLSIVGHVWTVFAHFKGGKGVACAAGMLLSLFPWAFLTILAIFLLIASTTRYVSLASITAMGLLPVVLALFSHYQIQQVPQELIWFSLIQALLVIFTHRENISRLLQGKENKFRGYDPKSAAKKS